MKIALVVPGGVDRSGEVRVIPALLALVRRLAAAHELHVFATHQEPQRGSWLLEGARVHNIGRSQREWRALRAIAAEHRTAPFAVVQAFFAGRCGALAVTAGALLRLPSFVHVAGGELVALPDIAYGGCASWRGQLLQRTVLRAATEVTAASAAICELVAQHRGHARRIPLGVDLQRWPLRPPRRRQRGAQARLVHVASLNRVKDQGTLLRAARLLAEGGCDFRLDVVGEDVLRGEMQALAAELGLARRVAFHGFLAQRELRPLVERADLAVISSRHEAGPVAVLEAAAVGVPTVGTAVGHIAEWSPRAARAVPCRDPAALAAAVAAVLENDGFRLELAEAALQHARREDADHTARLYEEMYRRFTEAAR